MCIRDRFAIGIGIAVVGLSFSPFLFGLGLFVAVLVGAEWTLTVWSERTSSDPEVNRAVRGRVIWPLEVPVGVAAGLAVIVFSMSRLFLATAGLGAAIIAGALALIVLTMAFVLSARPSINRGLVLAVVLVFGVIVIGAGIWGGVADNNKDHNTEEGAASSTAAPGGQTVASLLYPSASAASAAAS